MPIYEYQCRDCDHRLTARQRMSESPLVTCPQCEAEALQRLISQTSFVLKGTGWYASDYKTPATKGDGGGDTASPAADTAADGGGASAEGTPSSSGATSDD